MIKKVTSYKILISSVVLAILIIAVIGFWFADEKSAPVYLNKIDKLMFDTNNKAPKFVLTLPDADQMQSQQNSQISTEAAFEAKTEKPVESVKKTETLEDIIMQIPNLVLLLPKPATQQLKHITLADDLTESFEKKLLPKVSEDGRKPWNEYGKSVNIKPNFKKVAIVIKGLGLDAVSLDKIVKGLDSEISVSLSPYASDAGTKLISARQYGHETYIDLLLSSKNFLKSDNGPMSMSITISIEEALNRLRTSLDAGAPIGGVVVNDGIADDDNKELLFSILKELKNRGLLLIDATHGDGLNKIKVEGLPRRKADIVIDNDFNRDVIRKQLQQAEDIAFKKGHVLVVIDPKPVAIIEVYNWIKEFSPQVEYEDAKNMELKKPFAVVPVSNLVID
ncbi:MAG: hypothetical protein E7012_00305 [Alphaproteobacteria bacterium]|nr:hypothetical protein [Alphaproteobacteria bacterium]